MMVPLYINYTTKIVPEQQLVDNERKDDFRGCEKVCEYAQICAISHTQHNGFGYNLFGGKEGVLKNAYRIGL